jgi:hypothetical protein
VIASTTALTKAIKREIATIVPEPSGLYATRPMNVIKKLTQVITNVPR